MRRLKLYKNTGFTLVETLVAITVLTLALGGPMALATRSIKDSLASRNKVVAFYLAQEAIEYVKNVRDSNFLYKISGGGAGDFPTTNETGWLDGGGGLISSLTCLKIPFDGYNYNCSGGGSPSIFNREVKITDPDGITLFSGGDEAKITATITWPDIGGTRTVTLTQNMFNLAPAP